MSQSPVPVLMYHHVNPHKGDMFTVTPSIFEEQMAYLAKDGYKTLSLDELFAFMKGDLGLRQKAVVITFDDGWLDNFIYAFPVLEHYKLRAAIFIITDWVDNSSDKFNGVPVCIPTHEESKRLVRKGEEQNVVLTWEHIGKMADSGLIDFYSHTRSHQDCNHLSEPQMLEEFGESKKVLEERLCRPCHYLCWPHGMYSDAAISVARKTGYKALFTIERGAVLPGSDPLTINRINVEDNISEFRKKIQQFTHPIISLLYLNKNNRKLYITAKNIVMKIWF